MAVVEAIAPWIGGLEACAKVKGRLKPRRNPDNSEEVPVVDRRETDLCPAPGPVRRCAWATNELSIRYHDEEWGVPVHDDRRFFELLVLEGAQAGLSWDTILRKRDAYRAAFDGFDPASVAGYGEEKVRALLADPGIVRNRLKIA